MRDEAIIVLIPLIFIVAIWSLMIVRSYFRSRVRELEIRERIAMIEKGMVPPPKSIRAGSIARWRATNGARSACIGTAAPASRSSAWAWDSW